MGLLERLELAEPRVESASDGRGVAHVVAPAGVVDLLAELAMALARLGGAVARDLGLVGRAHGHSLPVGSDTPAGGEEQVWTGWN